eukprot:TRINITY_DN35226_c0_g1_i1.p1 TRINITY_DN35226_c0_g1~~TRINITY_DN35226_c0_g1_i1.p1  ORF type:complete len:404 (+),score=58.17 TRINITY_DN35226_c0_g1_i1:111-1322(+)
MSAATQKVHDPTQQEEGDEAQWVNEPLQERHPDLLVHTDRPFNAEPPNYALTEMITPETLHYRRQHTPVPVVDPETYRVSISVEGEGDKHFSLSSLKVFEEREVIVTFMCTGNRRSEMNTKEDGETMGLPWKNGSIGTAAWKGPVLRDVLKAAGIDEGTEEKGYKFVTFWGLEDYHISVPIDKCLAKDGDCILAWAMNGKTLPRDHGYPLRVVIPGLVGARSVKWISRIIATKAEVDGMHQVGIAYKQLGPNIKKLSDVSKEYIHALPPIDHVPITSAVTAPEPGTKLSPGDALTVAGYAYSGDGKAVIRVDVSLDGGKTWNQAELSRASETQGVRSRRAWAWVQWKYAAVVPENVPRQFDIVCKAVDDQYNQQPHEGSAIWNLRGILNTSWGRTNVECRAKL